MANACAARQLLPPPMQVASVAATAGAVQGSATVSAPAAAETLVGGTRESKAAAAAKAEG